MSLSTGDETTQRIHVGGILIQAEVVIKIDTGQSGQRENQLPKSPDIAQARPGQKPVKTDIAKNPNASAMLSGMDRCR